MRRIFGLDVLRSIAIAQVLLGHGMTLYLGQGSKTALEGFYGFLGVELFFVLSGFLVGAIALDMFERDPTPAGAADFMVRRWLRTLPNYYLFLGLNLVLAHWFGGGFDARYLVFLQNLLWPMPAFFGESWSLAVEELFYLALPLMLVLLGASTRSPRRLLALLAGALMAFTLARFAYVALLDPPFHEVVRKTAAIRLDSLMYGVVAAWAARFAGERFLKARTAKLALGLALIIACVRAVVVLAPEHVLAASAALSGVSLGVACTLPFLSTWRTGPGPARAAIEWISRISFSLYLCHLPLSRLMQAAGLGTGLGPMLAWLAASVALASLVHLGFERPVMNLRNRLPVRSHIQAAAAG